MISEMIRWTSVNNDNAKNQHAFSIITLELVCLQLSSTELWLAAAGFCSLPAVYIPSHTETHRFLCFMIKEEISIASQGVKIKL